FIPNTDIADFEESLERIYSREIYRVQVVDFLGMPELMRDGLFARMVMEHRDDAGGARRRLSLRKFILALGLHTGEEMESPDFLGPPPSYTLIRDPVLRLCHMMTAHSIAGRSQAPEKADPIPVQAPPPPTAANTIPQRMARLEKDVHKIHGALTEQREVIEPMAREFSRFNTWDVTGLSRMIDKVGVTYVPYSDTHVPYQRRRVRQRTGEASTSAAQ
ncbi:hypothetical protein Tco_1083237, partial [Tanacetum coccineum]